MDRQQPWHPFKLPGFCRLKGTSCVFLVIALIIVLPIIWYETQINKTKDDASHGNVTLPPPTSLTQVNHRDRRSIRFNRQLVNLFFVTGIDGVAEIDLCSVISCKDNQKAHVFSEKYICETYVGTRFPGDRRCGSWDFVITNSGLYLWNYKPRKASAGPDPLTDRLSIINLMMGSLIRIVSLTDVIHSESL